MLDILFGSKNIKKILIFLFVNNKCYGTQLHHLLDTPLTPVQKALIRLEKAHILTSYYEGKTRVYQLNPACPFLTELEQLLKKAYTLLPPNEKKLYRFVKQDDPYLGYKDVKSERILLEFWKKLSSIKKLVFHAKTKSQEENGRNGRGQGVVDVAKESESVLIFHEKGSWKGLNGTETDFTNSFRFTIDCIAGMISLEHLRYGLNHPVFLFHLAPSGKHALSSVDSHFCEGDTYFGQMVDTAQNLRLSWRVIGPKKNEEIDYYYTS